MTKDTTQSLAFLEAGMRKDFVSLQELEKDLSDAFDLTTEWDQAWRHFSNSVEVLMQQINALIAGLETDMDSTVTQRLTKTSDTCRTLHTRHECLVLALSKLKPQEGELLATDRKAGNVLLSTFKAYLATLHASVITLQTRLAGLHEHTEFKKNELDQAAIDIEHEQHAPGSLKDVINTMFLWVETPEERARKNRQNYD